MRRCSHEPAGERSSAAGGQASATIADASDYRPRVLAAAQLEGYRRFDAKSLRSITGADCAALVSSRKHCHDDGEVASFAAACDNAVARVVTPGRYELQGATHMNAAAKLSPTLHEQLRRRALCLRMSGAARQRDAR